MFLYLVFQKRGWGKETKKKLIFHHFTNKKLVFLQLKVYLMPEIGLQIWWHETDVNDTNAEKGRTI